MGFLFFCLIVLIVEYWLSRGRTSRSTFTQSANWEKEWVSFIHSRSGPHVRVFIRRGPTGNTTFDFGTDPRFSRTEGAHRHRAAPRPETPKTQGAYAVLGVSPDATPDQIKRAYYKLARKYHPDVNKAPGAEEKLKRINLAYEELTRMRA